MNTSPLNLLLADDLEDYTFLKKILEAVPSTAKLTTVNDGVQLVQRLSANETALPNALCVDLNISCKSGFGCLAEIKQNEKLKQLPVSKPFQHLLTSF